MATLNEITYDILETVRNNHISDDIDIDKSQIVYHINNQRALWIRNEYNKPGRKIDPSLIQDFGCLKLIEVDSAECCEITSECVILRTEKQLPNFIDLHDGPAITRVGPVSKVNIPFNFLSREQAILSSYNKFFKGVSAFWQNNYIYLIITNNNWLLLDYINVRGLVEDPTKLSSFKCADSEDMCFSYDKEYPISSWMLPYIKEPIMLQILNTLKIPHDKVNDGDENLNK